MQVAFCRSKKVGSAIIRAVTWSQWSHVALVKGDNIIEAVWPKVRESTLAELASTHDEVVIVDFPTPNDDLVWEAAKSQIGKPYDWTALIGIFLHRDWQEQDKWFCSELVGWSFSQAGFPLFRSEAVHVAYPQHIWMIHPTRNYIK